MKYPIMTPEAVRNIVARLPRVDLAHLPTPLEEVPRFAERLGGPRIFIKRDDCTGLLFGGNKTRHNEFLLAEALRQGADTVVWGAGVQSNNCRQTAAVYAAASGSTGAGLALGKALLGLSCSIRLISPIRWPWDMREDMAELGNRAAQLLDLPHRLRSSDIEASLDYIGAGYGIVTPGG